MTACHHQAIIRRDCRCGYKSPMLSHIAFRLDWPLHHPQHPVLTRCNQGVTLWMKRRRIGRNRHDSSQVLAPIQVPALQRTIRRHRKDGSSFGIHRHVGNDVHGREAPQVLVILSVPQTNRFGLVTAQHQASIRRNGNGCGNAGEPRDGCQREGRRDVINMDDAIPSPGSKLKSTRRRCCGKNRFCVCRQARN